MSSVSDSRVGEMKKDQKASLTGSGSHPHFSTPATPPTGTSKSLTSSGGGGAHPLLSALKKKNSSEAKKLAGKDSDAEINAQDEDGRTALHLAALTDQNSVIKALLKRKIDLNAKDKDNNTPLLLSCAEGNLKVIGTLMKAGADVKCTNSGQSTTLHLLCNTQKWKKDLLKPLRSLVEECKLNVNVLDGLGYTPLHLACSRSYFDVVTLLLKFKADPNIVATTGDVALLTAAEHGNALIVKALLESGADIAMKNAKGQNLMDIAKNNKDVLDTIKRHMATIPGGDRKLRQVTDEPPIVAKNFDELPPDVKRLVQTCDISVDKINQHWDIFKNVLFFVAKKKIVQSPDEIEKKKKEDTQPAKDSPAASPVVAKASPSKETPPLVTPGNPKDLFKKLQVTGKGGFGMVFSAISAQSSKTSFAIKRMPHASDRDKRLNLKEIKFLRDCSHPNIVKFHHAYESAEDHEIWVVMELLEGGTLDETVSEAGYDFGEKHIAFVCREILSGLQYLHQKHVVHRDLKAANIMLSIEGEIKMIDFGLAVEFTAPRTEMVGSPFWMPPEMIKRLPHGYSADIWSFAICVLELANKSPPISGSALKSMFNVATEAPPGLDKPDKWSSEFKHFLSRCLVQDPEKRATAEELLKHDFLHKAAKQSDMKQVLRQIFMGNQLKENGFF